MASNAALITTARHDGVLVITVLDKRLSEQQQVDEWQDQMAQAIRDHSPTGVVIDMQNVEYMTSIAMLPLIATRAVAEDSGARVVLCNLSPTVLEILTVSQLIIDGRPHVKHLAMAETLDDALAALAGPT
jgi:anti-anti-sigma factor